MGEKKLMKIGRTEAIIPEKGGIGTAAGELTQS